MAQCATLIAPYESVTAASGQFPTHALHNICWNVALPECVGAVLCVIIIARRQLSDCHFSVRVYARLPPLHVPRWRAAFEMPPTLVPIQSMTLLATIANRISLGSRMVAE